MALTETRPDTAPTGTAPADHDPPRTAPTAVERVLGSGDHKTVGRVFVGASLLFVACDLLLAALANLHAASGGDFLETSVAYRFQLNHPIGLLLCGAMPLLLGLAIYLVPLQVGSPAIAFPRAAALSLWSWLLGTALFSVALLVKGSYGGSSEKLTRLGHVSVGLLCLSLLLGVICVMVTVVSHRPEGMTISRVPYFAFSMLVTGALWLATLPVVLAIVTVWQIRRPSPSDLEAGAYPALEWIFHQPAIYIVAIPLLGLLADVAGAISGQRQKAYTVIQSLIVLFGALAFGSWAQGPEARDTLVWIVASVAIAIPVLAVLGGSLDTIRRGKLSLSGGFILVVSSIILLLLAVAAGAVQGIAPIGDGQLFDIAAGGFAGDGAGIAIGQFYLVIAAVVLAGIGATFFWGSRLYEGGLPSALALAIAPIALIGAAAFGLGHVIMGLALPEGDTAETLAGVSGLGALLLAVAALAAFLTVAAAALGAVKGVAGASAPETTGGTLEWATASPPVAGNFADVLPAVECEYPVLDRTEQGAK